MESNNSSTDFHCKFGSNLFASSKLISTSGLQPSTEIALLMVCNGTHQLRTPSFSRNVAAGRTTSAYCVVGRHEKIDRRDEIELLESLAPFLRFEADAGDDVARLHPERFYGVRLFR